MIMTRYEIEQGLDALYRDLDNVQNMDEETARRVYNVDCKADFIEVIEEEIDTYEAILQDRTQTKITTWIMMPSV